MSSEGLAGSATEQVRPEFSLLDTLAVPDLVALMASEAARPAEALGSAVPQISRAVTDITERLALGGRLFYVGAGSAGRLGVLDAAELGPTFSVPEGVVLGVVAGGPEALVRAKEGAEDDEEEGAVALRRLGCSSADAVVGISASGRTPFVVGALAEGRAVEALTVAVVCNRNPALGRDADIVIELIVGGEVIAGSTRLNAGTAQKMALNIISTATMVQLGKTYGNLMVDMRATNAKLRVRAVRIVSSVTGVAEGAATAVLDACGWQTKLACASIMCGVEPADAAELLASHAGHLRAVVESEPRRAEGPLL